VFMSVLHAAVLVGAFDLLKPVFDRVPDTISSDSKT